MPLKKKADSRQQNGDALFRQLAGRYVEAEGASLRRELEQMQETPPDLLLDAKVRMGIRKRRKGWAAVGMAAAAACVVLVLALPRFLGGVLAPSSSGEETDGTVSSIAFTATLPANLSVADTRQDKGQTIYYLEDTQGDDVVMTLERAPLPDTTGMDVRRIDGTRVYTRTTADYALLMFRLKGVTYTLTCRYELDTLLEAAEEIL